MANYEKSRYWTVFEEFIDADFRPLSEAKVTKHIKDVALESIASTGGG